MKRRLLAFAALGALAVGASLNAAGRHSAGSAVWAVATAGILLPLTLNVVRSLLRRDVGVDAIALVAIASALALGEYLAGAVVALMPRIAHRRRGEKLEEIRVDELCVGDIVVVRAGEVVPVDGEVVSPVAAIDESALTGEALPVELIRGAEVRSGSANAGDAFDLCTTRTAEHSAYAAIVRLVRQAETEPAPFVRIADRYA